MRLRFKIWSVVTILEIIIYGLLSVMIFMRSVTNSSNQNDNLVYINWFLCILFCNPVNLVHNYETQQAKISKQKAVKILTAF